MFLNFNTYIEMINESKLNQNIQKFKDYLLLPQNEKEKEFKELFPDKNYDGTPTKDDIEISKKDGAFKTIRKDTSGRDRVVNRKYPSHYYFTYQNDIQKDRWLIHFSNAGSNIFKDGKFKFGSQDYKYIGYTNRQSMKGKLNGGFNFAYLLNDAITYGLNKNANAVLNLDTFFKEDDIKNKSHYGKEIVIFKANGIKVRTWLNNEPQVVFWGPEAYDINLITNVQGKWSIKLQKTKLNTNFFKSFWEQYVKPYSKNQTIFDEKLYDHEDYLKFDNLKDAFKFFENDYDKHRDIIQRKN